MLCICGQLKFIVFVTTQKIVTCVPLQCIVANRLAVAGVARFETRIRLVADATLIEKYAHRRNNWISPCAILF